VNCGFRIADCGFKKTKWDMRRDIEMKGEKLLDTRQRAGWLIRELEN
jgi:hypothetical protein